MRSHNAFFAPTTSLALSVSEDRASALWSRASSPKPIFYAQVSPSLPSKKAGSVDVQDLVNEFQSMSSAHAKAMRQGREWVAQSFYPNRTSLAQLRLSKGWSQAELAQRAQTSQSYVARLEQGAIDPQISTVEKIAAALEVSFQTLSQALLEGLKK